MFWSFLLREENKRGTAAKARTYNNDSTHARAAVLCNSDVVGFATVYQSFVGTRFCV